MQVKKQQLELNMEQQTGSKSRKEYLKYIVKSGTSCILPSILPRSMSSISSPCLFNFYAEYIMRNAGLDETQAEIKIAGRNISNLRYADDITLMAESEEELKSLLMKGE